MAPGCVVGADLGGTRFRAVVADLEGNIRDRASILTRAQEGREAVLRRIKDTIYSLIGSAETGSVAGIGIGVPGPLENATGVLFHPPNLPGWERVPLKAILEEEFNFPVYVGNDANLGALAEYRFGQGRDTTHLFYITVSTGIGGGAVLGGQLYLGATGGEAEVGHMTVDMKGPRCKCGNIGCVEALASGPAIARRATELIATGAPSALREMAGSGSISCELVLEAAKAGDELAARVVHDAFVALGVSVVNLLHLLNPQMIVIGGGVANNAGPLLFDTVRATVAERAMPFSQRDVRIVPTVLGDDVVIWGALALVLSQ